MSEKLEACPHCGEKLPWIVDAYCPSCDRRLDDPPPPPIGAARSISGSAETRSGSPLVGLALFGGLGALFIAVLIAVRGNVIEAVCTGAVAVAMLLGGAMRLGRKNDPGGGTSS